MGTMPAPDAAPLPRLGEVFFDVRGDSRTMRVSWYADTGVAVFSIWQGDTCTGTFRLPIPDLPRMVEALAQGPPGTAGPGYPGRAPGGGLGDAPPARHQEIPSPRGYGGVPPAGCPAPPPGGYPEMPDGYPDAPGGYRDGPAGHPDVPPGGDHRYVQQARYPPTGPLPVGQWRAPEPGGEYAHAAPDGGYAAPDGGFPADPLSGGYHGEAEQGYLPSPPTDMFPAAGYEPGPGEYRGREYGHSRGRS